MFEPELRTEQNGGTYPVAPAQQVLSVRRAIPRPLASHVVKVFVADADVVMRRDLILLVVDDRPFRSVTGHFVSVVADSSVSAVNQKRRRGGVVHIGRVGLILI